jgi:catechol 2,3-dioxygenase-like lactoylglutathione lyase family enzyme
LQLLDHVSITVRTLSTVRPFYLAVMSALGAVVAYDGVDAIGFGERNRPHDDGHTYLSLYESIRATPDPRRHYCFRATSQAQVDAFFAAGLSTGGTSDGAPGLRTYHPEYYAAFLLDPEGNKLEAVFHRGATDA